MRLSEAIRLGAMLHPQCFGGLVEMLGDTILATCALGAAEQAGYYWSTRGDGRMLLCPNCPRLRCGIAGMVQHLNDGHRWTREQIADWVETQERAEDLPRVEGERADVGACVVARVDVSER